MLFFAARSCCKRVAKRLGFGGATKLASLAWDGLGWLGLAWLSALAWDMPRDICRGLGSPSAFT